MKILYLSCHSILEHDEITLLRELGHHVFTPGDYVDDDNPGRPSLRPSLENEGYADDLAAFNSFGAKGPKNKGRLEKSFVDRFDAVIVMHLPRWIKDNWEAMKHKTVIWRTIGQSSPEIERELAPYRRQGLQIVRYSPRERYLPGYLGEDEVIRFYKDPSELSGWGGGDRSVMTVSQYMTSRREACKFDLFRQVAEGFAPKLYGPGNADAGPMAQGEVSYEELKAALRRNRCFLYTGTYPASYTLGFIEAWMTGIPVVAIGPRLMESGFPKQHLYEIPELIRSGVDGFWSDDPRELRRFVGELMDDESLARKVSEAGRASAISLFGKDAIRARWSHYLSQLGYHALGEDLKRRVRMTRSCDDSEALPRVPGAGEVFEEKDYRYQRMHNGLKVIEDCYHGRGTTEIIRAMQGHHEPQEERVFHEVLKYLPEKATMVEMGSHWSFYSLWFHQKVAQPTNHMIEPDPANLQAGRRNFEINGMEGVFHQYAIGATSAPPFPFECEADNVIRMIPRTCLDDFVAEQSIPFVDLLLCDIQGYELQMLQGAVKTIDEGKLRFLFLSTHHHLISHDPLIHARCMQFLQERGAHFIAHHTVSESYSGDGLIVVSFLPEDRRIPPVRISKNHASNSLFREVEYDLDEAWKDRAQLKERVGELESQLSQILHSRSWKLAQSIQKTWRSIRAHSPSR